MDYRGVLLFTTVLGAAGLATVSCSAPDPGTITFSERGGGGGGGDTPSGSSGTSSGSSGTSGTSGTSGASGTSAGDGGGPAGGDPVFGATPFAAGNPPGAPAKGKQPHQQINAELDPSGANCMQCHAGTWAFGGTLYATINGGARVAGAEIRVTGPDGKTYASAYSDADGNFWVQSVGQPIPANSRTGVRNAAGKVKLMTGTVTGDGGRACNEAACHGLANNRVYLD